jgi:hypothetical protein
LAILVACEDAACGFSARTVIERVLPLLPFEAEAHTTIQEFAAFKPGPFDLSDRLPDIVIVSAHGQKSLPVNVKGWLETWAQCGHGLTCAMTAVFDRQLQLTAAATEIKSYLQKIARAAAIDWLEAGFAPAVRRENYRQDLSNKATTVSTTLTEIIRKVHPSSWA